MSTPGVEPGLSRPQRDVLTTRRCGLLCLARLSEPGEAFASFQAGVLSSPSDGVAPELGKAMGFPLARRQQMATSSHCHVASAAMCCQLASWCNG